MNSKGKLNWSITKHLKNKNFLLSGLCFSLSVCTFPSFSASNPASVSFVNQAIETAFRSAVQMTTYTAGTGIDITDNTISQTASYEIGDPIGNYGVVFYVDETKRHGLLVSYVDQSPSGGSPMCATSDSITCPPAYIFGGGIGNGAINTAALIGAQLSRFTDSTSPADILTYAPTLATMDTHIGTNWYLPSSYELILLYQVLTDVNATLNTITDASPIAQGAYWASNNSTTSLNPTQFYQINMTNGSANLREQDALYNVRGIGQF